MRYTGNDGYNISACMSVDVIPKTSKRLEGTVVEIQCSAGSLNSQYMWLRDGRELDDDSRYLLVILI